MLLTWMKVTVINFAEGGVHTASTKKLNSDFMPPHHHTFINTEEDDPAEHAVDKLHESPCTGFDNVHSKVRTGLSHTALCHSLQRRYLIENSIVNRDYRMLQQLNDLPQDV